MMPEKVDEFVRYYEVLAYDHAVSSGFNAAWASLTAMEKWIKEYEAPKDRCRYDRRGRPNPAFVRPSEMAMYGGSGDDNVAVSFECVK
ncbi:MAG: hypothetical protein COA37_14415 [Hoeflea sp.]|nr:MAG: hypothetical protein COA37_14415 [Hoeflea sp.]